MEDLARSVRLPIRSRSLLNPWVPEGGSSPPHNYQNYIWRIKIHRCFPAAIPCAKFFRHFLAKEGMKA